MSEEIKKYEIELANVSIVGEDYYVFDFLVPEGIEFKEGQYGVFIHIDKEILGRKIRPFSIASSTNENIFRFGLKIIKEPSDFKAKMRDLKIGEKMLFNGPMGTFTLEKDFNCVFIAGGIGITPIRGLIKKIEHLKLKKEVELIHSETRGVYPFKDEFDNLGFVKSHYESNTDDTKKRINNAALTYLNSAFYYVSGSPGFINGIKEQLVDNGINSENIKFDRFSGY